MTGNISKTKKALSLTDYSVTSSKIANGAVTADKLAKGAIDGILSNASAVVSVTGIDEKNVCFIGTADGLNELKEGLRITLFFDFDPGNETFKTKRISAININNLGKVKLEKETDLFSDYAANHEDDPEYVYPFVYQNTSFDFILRTR